MPDALGRLARALKPGGALYASFKYGHGEREHGGQRFTDLDEVGLDELLSEVSALELIECWTSGDVRLELAEERWFNALLRACEGNAVYSRSQVPEHGALRKSRRAQGKLTECQDGIRLVALPRQLQDEQGSGQSDQTETDQFGPEIEAVQALKGLYLGWWRGARDEIEGAAELYHLGLDPEMGPGHEDQGQGQEDEDHPCGPRPKREDECEDAQDQLAAVPGLEEDPVEFRGMYPEEALFLNRAVAGVKARPFTQPGVALKELR